MKTPNLILVLAFATMPCIAGEMSQPAAEIVAVDTKIQEIRSRVSPASGETEAMVSARFGQPRGATTPDREAQNGRYDVDGVGLYRWFYRSDVYRKEEVTGLSTVFSVEMVVYFIDRKVVGSTLEISPQNARRYISGDGVVESYSGSLPVLRRKADGSLYFDYHGEEGILQTRNQLLAMLESYEALLTMQKKIAQPTHSSNGAALRG